MLGSPKPDESHPKDAPANFPANLALHERQLAFKAWGHAPGVSVVSGHACLIRAASTPACAGEHFPTPELPRRTGSLSRVPASAPITSAVSRALPKKKTASDWVIA